MILPDAPEVRKALDSMTSLESLEPIQAELEKLIIDPELRFEGKSLKL